MINNPNFLINSKKYSKNFKIYTADGIHLPIIVTGDISYSLANVFVSSNLISNLVSIGQLVDNNYKVKISKSSCIVQDQQSGKIIVIRPKLRHFFPLSFPSSPCFSLSSIACNSAHVDYRT